MKTWLERLWYQSTRPPRLLLPLAVLYRGIAGRIAARRKSEAIHLSVPVVIVGNISVGGTGKTPFVIWLINELRALGWRPGVVSRGYGGRAPAYPLRVTAETSTEHCGDEPALIARRTGAPVAVAPDRVAAAQLLLDDRETDIIIADDGLQHYRLARNLEICVVDGSRGIGNGACLPAGPLREPPERLNAVNLIVINGACTAPLPPSPVPTITMHIATRRVRRLQDNETRAIETFAGQTVHAVAGIGNPTRFFEALRAHGLRVIPHPFPDHYRYAPVDLCFDDDRPVLMTDKDAVKCVSFALPQLWAVSIEPQIEAADAARVRELLAQLRD